MDETHYEITTKFMSRNWSTHRGISSWSKTSFPLLGTHKELRCKIKSDSNECNRPCCIHILQYIYMGALHRSWYRFNVLPRPCKWFCVCSVNISPLPCRTNPLYTFLMSSPRLQVLAPLSNSVLSWHLTNS